MLEPNATALDFLLNRRSCHRLTGPGPDDDDLATILQAAQRAPDFQRLRPYRFLAARGEGLERLGAALRQAAIASGQPQETIDRAAKMPQRAPLVIVAVSSPKPSATVPLLDQQLCGGCAVLLMQMAARALGYGGVWRTGWPTQTPFLGHILGLAEGERIIGFLYLGSPAHAEEPRPEDPPPLGLAWL